MINPILSHYQDLINEAGKPFDAKVAQLSEEKTHYTAKFPDPVISVLTGLYKPSEVVEWPMLNERNRKATELLDECIAHVNTERQQAMSGLEHKSNHILASYKACLDFKKKVLLMSLTGEPIPMIINSFKAQREALELLLDGAPKTMVEAVMKEIDETGQPSSIGELID